MKKNVKDFDLKKKLNNFVFAVRQKVIPIVWAEFTEQVFVDEKFGKDKWADRKKADKNPKKRNLLVKSGSLRANALNVKTRNEDIYVNISSTPYGTYHNDGDKPQPKRQFLGRDEKLFRKIIAGLKRQFKKDFK